MFALSGLRRGGVWPFCRMPRTVSHKVKRVDAFCWKGVLDAPVANALLLSLSRMAHASARKAMAGALTLE